MGLFSKIFKKRSNPAAPDSLKDLRKIIAREYQAAEQGRLLADWPTTGQTADEEIYAYLQILRNRSRHLAKNNDYARRFLHLLKTNVVGAAGVQLQARAKFADGTLDKADNDYIENEFRLWGRAGVCTADGRLSFLDCQNLFIDTIARDGEVIARHLTGWRENRFRYAIQFIEPDRLDHNLNGKAKNGNIIRLGVELNKWRRPVAYYFAPEDFSSLYIPGATNYSPTTKHERIPANEIIHKFIPTRIAQTRGIPWMATSARRLHMLNGYEEAELVAARTAAAKMGFFKSPSGEEYTGEDTTDEPATARPSAPIMNAEPGTFEELPEGMDFIGWDPDHPTGAYENFVLSVLRGVASGLGVSYVSLANDLRGVSYSSIRQGALDERDFYRTLQYWFIEHFLTPVFNEWLYCALTLGQTNLPPVAINKFRNVVWRPRGWQWVDPLKEVNAHVKAVENGFRSFQDVIGDQGRDAAETFNELADEIDIADNIGIKIPLLQNLKGAQNAAPNEDNKNAAILPIKRQGVKDD